MEKLSFASAYRTAAILAAFSRASASCEEGLQVRPSALVANHPSATGADEIELVRLLTQSFYRVALRICGRPWRDRSLAEAANVNAGWPSHHRSRDWDGVGQDRSRPHVISHFALCDDAVARPPT